MKLEMERHFLAESVSSFGVYLWLSAGGQGRITRRQSVKKFHENFLLLHNSLYVFWSLATTGKEKLLTTPIQTYMVNSMKCWTPLLMMFLCMVLLSVLGGMKEKHNHRWWGWVGDQKGCWGCACFWTKEEVSCLAHLTQGSPSLDYLERHQLPFYTQRSKKLSSWSPSKSFNASFSNLESSNVYLSAFRYIP